MAADVTDEAEVRRLVDTATAVPLGRIERPDDVASLVTYLASDAAGFVTGQVISVNGGHVI